MTTPTPTSARPRISPGGRDDVGLFAWGFSRVSGLVTRTSPPNLFLTMGRQPKLFRGWLRFAGRMMPGGKLPRRDTELVILRVASLRECDYEFSHHVRLGKRAGVTAEDVVRVRMGSEAVGWTPRERALLHAVELLHSYQDLDDDAWTELRSHLSEPESIEFILLVGHYEMLATFIGTLRIQTDTAR